jgi:hypothetical protein
MVPRYRFVALILVCLALVTHAAPARAQDSFFDVFLESWMPAPPYPTTTPARFDVLNDAGAGLVPLQRLSMGLTNAGLVGGATLSTLGTGSNGAEPGYLAPDSFFDVFLESAVPPPGGGQTVMNSFFDIYTEVFWSAGGVRGTMVPIDATYPPGDVRRWVKVQWLAPDSFFDVWFQVAVPELPGSVIRYTARYTLGPDVVAAGGAIGGNPVVSYLAPDSFFDIFLEMVTPTGLGVGMKALRVTTTAQLLGGAVPATTTTWGRVKSLYR